MSLLADAGIFSTIRQRIPVNASPVRGYSIGIAGRAPAGTTLYYIYVSAKDHETASALLFNGKEHLIAVPLPYNIRSYHTISPSGQMSPRPAPLRFSALLRLFLRKSQSSQQSCRWEIVSMRSGQRSFATPSSFPGIG